MLTNTQIPESVNVHRAPAQNIPSEVFSLSLRFQFLLSAVDISIFIDTILHKALQPGKMRARSCALVSRDPAQV